MSQKKVSVSFKFILIPFPASIRTILSLTDLTHLELAMWTGYIRLPVRYADISILNGRMSFDIEPNMLLFDFDGTLPIELREYQK